MATTLFNENLTIDDIRRLSYDSKINTEKIIQEEREQTNQVIEDINLVNALQKQLLWDIYHAAGHGSYTAEINTHQYHYDHLRAELRDALINKNIIHARKGGGCYYPTSGNDYCDTSFFVEKVYRKAFEALIEEGYTITYQDENELLDCGFTISWEE